MKFPLKEFIAISTKKIKPTYHKSYTNKFRYIPLISDNNGERWICYFKKGFYLNNHSHEGRYEIFILSGKIQYTNPNTLKSVILEEGDYYCNPKGVEHNEICLEDCKVLWIYDKNLDTGNFG